MRSVRLLYINVVIFGRVFLRVLYLH
jgi:hypothetical protein